MRCSKAPERTGDVCIDGKVGLGGRECGEEKGRRRDDGLTL